MEHTVRSFDGTDNIIPEHTAAESDFTVRKVILFKFKSQKSGQYCKRVWVYVSDREA